MAKSTSSHYNSVFKKWEQFCNVTRVDPWNANVKLVLMYLNSLFEGGHSYSSINVQKSALSTILSMRLGVKLGENELIKKFMKGVYRLRPPAAKYNVTWNADALLRLFQSWEDNANLSIKVLSQKLLGLLALVTGQRVQSLASIKICDIVWGAPVQIKLTAHLKTSRPGVPNHTLVLTEYGDSKLCVVSTLKEYLGKTSSYRGDNQSLFLSTVRPYKPVCAQTLSNWLVSLLHDGGIDTTSFHGHSFRHASSSKAAAKGVNVDTILQHVGWSRNSSVFARFYNRPIVSMEEYASAVLELPLS